jgi:hypothetical protein
MWQQRCCTSIQVTAECALVYYDVFLVRIHSVTEQNGNLQNTKIPIRSSVKYITATERTNGQNENVTWCESYQRFK